MYMQKQWVEWFNSLFNSQLILKEHSDRKYYFLNIDKSNVPFHTDLSTYILSLSSITAETEYSTYHLHKWEEGCFFNEHIDSRIGRKWAYVYELQAPICGTSLLVEGKPKKECLFSSNILHEVPTIQEGTRLSLTVFGYGKKTVI